ncbi:9472_t:CDS:2 [Funneliformis geosporum]|uniref:9472_t:CDS:1 n=1 Tax=Funneliformis geosporum TaxID=1117311 RepID=A0A9W4SCA0_9GLOM|nr:9472_t:CDS:2 [Funneliformis geosporum]
MWVTSKPVGDFTFELDTGKFAALHLQPCSWNQLNDPKSKSSGLGYMVSLVNSIGGPNMSFIVNIQLKFRQDVKVKEITFILKNIRNYQPTRQFVLYIKKMHHIQLNVDDAMVHVCLETSME